MSKPAQEVGEISPDGRIYRAQPNGEPSAYCGCVLSDGRILDAKGIPIGYVETSEEAFPFIYEGDPSVETRKGWIMRGNFVGNRLPAEAYMISAIDGHFVGYIADADTVEFRHASGAALLLMGPDLRVLSDEERNQIPDIIRLLVEGGDDSYDGPYPSLSEEERNQLLDINRLLVEGGDDS